MVPTAPTETRRRRSRSAAARRSSATASTRPGSTPSRSQGVVTIYSFFGGRPALAGLRLRRLGRGPRADELARGHERRRGSGPCAGASRVYVVFADGDRIPGSIVGWDLFNDIGLVKVDPDDHAVSPLPLGDSSRVVVGEPVAAIGSPFGQENSLAVGVVSATERSIASLTSDYDVSGAIQVDAPINHGNSGGPLLDAAAA